MTTCPYCQADVAEDINFCPECFKQVKCRSRAESGEECGATLRAGAPICLVCGATVPTNGQNAATAENTYSLEEEITESTARRKIDLKLSDEAIRSGVGFLSDHLPIKGGRLITPQGETKRHLSLPPLDVSASYEEDAVREEAVEEVKERVDSRKQETLFDQPNPVAGRLFQKKDDMLLARVRDFKGHTKEAQQRRFTLLYLWAYPQLFERNVPSKTHLHEAADKQNLYNARFTKYSADVIRGYANEDESGLYLIPSNLAEVENLALEVLNEGGQEGYAYWETSSSGRSKRASVGKKKQKMIEQWVAKPSSCSGVDPRIFDTAWQWAAFTLYDLTHELKVVPSVSPILAYTYLTTRYDKVDVSKKGFRDALSRDDERFGKDSEGNYFLEQKGEEDIVAILENAERKGNP